RDLLIRNDELRGRNEALRSVLSRLATVMQSGSKEEREATLLEVADTIKLAVPGEGRWTPAFLLCHLNGSPSADLLRASRPWRLAWQAKSDRPSRSVSSNCSRTARTGRGTRSRRRPGRSGTAPVSAPAVARRRCACRETRALRATAPGCESDAT